jgi:hypothetical protein
MSKISDFPTVTDVTPSDYFVAMVGQDGSIFTNAKATVRNILNKIQAPSAVQLGGVKIGTTAGLNSDDGDLTVKLKASSGLTKDANGIALILNNPLLTKGYSEAYISFTQTGTSAPVGVIRYSDTGFVNGVIDDQALPSFFTRESLGVYRMYFGETVDVNKIFVFPEKTVFNDGGEMFQMEVSMTTTYIQFNFSSYEPVSDPPFASAEYDGFPAFKYKVVVLP